MDSTRKQHANLTMSVSDNNELQSVGQQKKHSMFSISSILGEDVHVKKQTQLSCKIPDTAIIIHGSNHVEGKENNPQCDDGNLSSQTVNSHDQSGTIRRVQPDVSKYNALLTQFANSDVTKLYRWPLFWNPWMGIQGTPSIGLQRSSIQQQQTLLFGQTAIRPDCQRIHSVGDSKDALEAGEIIRPVAFRSAASEGADIFKNNWQESLHRKMLPGRTPSPLKDRHSDKELENKFNDCEHKSFCDSDVENDMVDIEEADDSDNEGQGNIDSSLTDSSCERKKKTRTVFSRSQIFQLETMFDMKRYLSSSERAGLAKALNMTETQVKIWFQNRRNKWKRQIAAEMEAANISQVAGQRLMQLPYMYSPDDITRGLRPPLPISQVHSNHPLVPPSVHNFYGGMIRTPTN